MTTDSWIVDSIGDEKIRDATTEASRRRLRDALEIAESIDMMRFLQHGIKVRMAETRITTHAVDTVDDLNMVEGLMAEDPLLQCY